MSETEALTMTDTLVPGQVAARAAARPEAPAVASGDRLMTYGALDHAARRLANRLRQLGVGPDVVVALCLPRSPAMVVGALGILEAGGAYLPLDPAQPPERLAQLLCDARPAALVAAAADRHRLPSGPWTVLGLDDDGCAEGPEAPEAEPLAPSPEDLAYVIYTSGSTGAPKGVEVTHANLSHLVRWHRQAFDVVPADRATLIASPSFDASVWEIWAHLCAGASLHVPADAVRQDPAALRDWLVGQRISLTFLPTALAESVMELDWPTPAALRLLLTGADALRRHPRAGLPFAVVNNYGPTECTVVATSGPVPPGAGPDLLPTIGRPIEGVAVHVLDEALRPVRPGTVGELHIGGAGVARGYRNRPRLTAEKFIQHPLGATAGSRLYKTGDLGYRRPDGQLCFLGRIDDQVKIRGHRVEPAEIVTALLAHPEVAECAVAAHGTASGDRRLAAYVVPGPGAPPTLRSLRGFLEGRLPDYMVPSAFVLLDRLPRNASGKVDRAALPAPDADHVLVDEEAFVAPRTPVERQVATVLAPLLGLESVSALDNFFMLGGHSMLGTQLIVRLRDVFAVELPLRTLFDVPTVAGLAGEIERLLMEKLAAITEDEAERMLQ